MSDETRGEGHGAPVVIHSGPLSMFGAKAEMEDLSFAVVNPDAFRAVINARVDEWYRPDDGKSSKKAKTRTKTDLSEDDAASTDLSSEVESDEPASDDDDDASTSEAASKSAFTMTWEPPTGADVQMFFERVLRGENAGTPRRHSPRGEKERAMEAERRARQVRLEAMAAALTHALRLTSQFCLNTRSNQ